MVAKWHTSRTTPDRNYKFAERSEIGPFERSTFGPVAYLLLLLPLHTCLISVCIMMAADFVRDFSLLSPATQDQIRNEISASSNMATAENILSLFKLLDSDSQHHVAKTLPYLYPREARKQLSLLKNHTERAIKIVKYGRKYIVSDKKRAEKRVKREAKKKAKEASGPQQPVAGAAVSTVTEQIDWGQYAAAVPVRHEYEEEEEDSDESGATETCKQRFAYFTSSSASGPLVTGAPATGRGVEELIPGMLTDMMDPEFPDDPEPLAKLYPYVNEYRELTHERQGIAVDVEFVHMHGEPHVPRAAIVSAVDQAGRVVMNLQDQQIKVLEKENEIRKVVINKWTKKVNGITGPELLRGISPQELKKKAAVCVRRGGKEVLDHTRSRRHGIMRLLLQRHVRAGGGHDDSIQRASDE